MNRASSWSNKEVDFNVREAAEDAARRAGLSLQDWLDETWRIHAADIRASVADLDDDERAYAVARRLSRKRAPSEGSRRGDQSHEGMPPRRNVREADDRIWNRVTNAFADLENDQPTEARFESPREPAPRRIPRDRSGARAPLARARLSIDEAIEDIAERQHELESPKPAMARAPRHEDESHPPLKLELAKVTRALADLQRETVSTASAADVEALRRDVSHITRGLAALAPRESIEHMEAAVSDLSRRLSEARTAGLVDEFIEPVEALIGDLKRTMLGAAPTAALEAIEKRMGLLARNFDALAEARVDPDAIVGLLEHSHDIREMLKDAAARRPNIEGLEKRIADLGGRIDRISERGATSAGLDAIVKSVAEIRADVETQNPIKVVKALDGRINALARKLDQAATRADVDGHFDRLGKRLDAIHRDLAERAPDNSKLEEMFASLQSRLDQARPAAGPVEMRDLVTQLMSKIDQAVGGGAQPQHLSALEDQISRVAARLDTGLAPRDHAQQVDIARIESLLTSIAQRLENPLPISSADQVQETVRLLIERFESTLRSGVTGETLGAIERRLADVAVKLEAPVMAELDTARLESMIQDLAARMEDPSVAASDVIEIKRTLAQIADRMDAGLRGESQESFRGLEDQIAALTQRMENTSDAGVAKIERSLNDIQDQMERLRSEFDNPERETLEREIADLRSLHSSSDKRTHATLNAVHETLEKVVDRLAMLEDEIDQAPRPAQFTSPVAPPLMAPVAPAPRSEPDSYKPSIELNFGPPEPIEEPVAASVSQPVPTAKVSPPPAAAAPKIELPRATHSVVADRGGSDAMRRVPPPPAQSSGPVTDDFLLEPGSGKPAPRDVASAVHTHQASPTLPAAAMPPMPASGANALDTPLQPATHPVEPESPDAQASFIAAVRRAQQAAGETREGGSTGNQLLDEARARARAAAAEAEAKQTKKSGGGAFKLKSLFSGKKSSTTAAGVTGLVVVLGALQAASMFYQTDKARSQRTAENITTSPTPGKLPEKTATRVDAPRLGAIAPPADRFAQTAPIADMTPVASVPVNASTRAPAPLLPQDPFKLADAGDALAQYELGIRFAEGRHGPRDAAKAIEWLTKAAGQDFPPAQYRLGVIYEKGLGVARDSERARALYIAAAHSGNVKAMHNLGALLADSGADGKPDYANAARWFRRAAEHGVRDSQYNLAILSARGLGMQQDLVESYVWFSAASLQGDADAGAKLKEVSARLDAAQLARAQASAKTQRAKPMDPKVNEPLEPEGGWATAPESTLPKPAASRSPKISSLQAR